MKMGDDGDSGGDDDDVDGEDGVGGARLQFRRCCSSTEWFVGYSEMQAMLCCRSKALKTQPQLSSRSPALEPTVKWPSLMSSHVWLTFIPMSHLLVARL